MYVSGCGDLSINYLLNQDSAVKVYFDGEEVKRWNILVLEKMYKLNNNDRELIFNDCFAVNITLSIPDKDVSVFVHISNIVK